MCQWKFFVFKYSANTSARMAFMAPAMSLVGAAFRSVGVRRDPSCLALRSAIFFSSVYFIKSLPIGIGSIRVSSVVSCLPGKCGWHGAVMEIGAAPRQELANQLLAPNHT